MHTIYRHCEAVEVSTAPGAWQPATVVRLQPADRPTVRLRTGETLSFVHPDKVRRASQHDED